MNGAYAGLRLAACPGGTPEDEDHLDTATQGASASEGKKDKPMPDTDTQTAEREAAISAARSEATLAANARFSAVLASDQYAGRELLAQTLLGNDKLSADEILVALAAAPVPGTVLSTEVAAEAAEAGGRAVMKDALAETKNSDIDAGAAAADAKKTDRASIDSQWDRARADANPQIQGVN